MPIDLIINVSVAFSVAPAIAGVSSYKLHTKELRILFIFLLISMLFSFAARTMGLYGMNNMLLYNIYTPIEYTFLAIVISYYQSNEKIKMLNRFSIPVFWIFIILAKMSYENPMRFDNISTSVESLLLIGFSGVAVLRFLSPNPLSLTKQPSFFVLLSVLIYFTGNALSFVIGPILTWLTWLIIHSFLSILSKLLYSWSFLCLKKLPV